ncbi:helix-turn-helix transcriptional regulator [Streptomonospora wellingtoniae]|uniref:Helix-turn-helix transcriptional regulator n=1 Tax=Streptomonospora wellingtoniae TaxID=3075544 RepID=A0ABU2KU16_9ACTN|nr:helix-turn-helix transcriptional regulator [Streptomonospora sp. DSM 45055]MDT0302795.1 helix-turn-helix transcriptional regulator [Streptomonospora sp. DSM 45055]
MNPTRATRAQLARGAARIRADQQRHGAPVHAIAAQITRDLPITQLEAWRLAYGWSRPSVVDAVGEVYRSDGLAPPGLTTAMLCRWEHGQARPGWEYVAALARVYRVDPSRLGVSLPTRVPGWYGHRIPQPRQEPPMPAEHPDLSAVADSIALHGPGSGTGDLAERALGYYNQHYSDYPPRVLASEVARCRGLLITHQDSDTRRVLGWLSAMLGNLTHHTGDATGALIHLGTAARIGAQVGEPHLAGWALGAQSMVATSQHRYAEALELADQAEPYADTALRRAQVVAWCRLRPLAAMGNADVLARAVASARRHMDQGEEQPGRFGFDRAEFELHVAEALVAGDPAGAARHAEASAGLKRTGSPGWSAATAVLARTHAARHDSGAACTAADEVLDAVPPERMRETTRARLRTLVADLSGQETPGVRGLEERVRALG